MKLGVKIWSDNFDSFQAIQKLNSGKLVDYAEIYVIPGTFDANKLKDIRNVPVIFHAPHTSHGFNIVGRDKSFSNAVQTIKQFADYFGEKRVIVHPGVSFDIVSTPEQNISGYKILEDAGIKLIIENMPRIGIDGKSILFGSTPSELKLLLSAVKSDLCVDIGHAICAANYYKKDPLSFIDEFLGLNPFMFHFCDGDYASVTDVHKSLGEGNFPLTKILTKLTSRKDKKELIISLETPKKGDLRGLSEDLKNIARLRGILDPAKLK